MSPKNAVDKPKTQRGKRELAKRDSKVHENDKKTLFVRNSGVSDTVTKALKDLMALKKTLSMQLNGKNKVLPFEDLNFMERMCQKYDCSMFAVGSHSKKRPHNIVLGRLHERELLDMYELGISRFESIAELAEETIALGTKPCLVFSGDFDEDEELKMLKNFLIDFFRGPRVEALRPSGLEHVLHFTALFDPAQKAVTSDPPRRVQLDSHRVMLKKAAGPAPEAELRPMGPRIELILRRVRLPNPELWGRAIKRPKEAKIQKKKNISMDAFGSKVGKVHLEKQDYEKVIAMHKRMQRQKAKRLQ